MTEQQIEDLSAEGCNADPEAMGEEVDGDLDDGDDV